MNKLSKDKIQSFLDTCYIGKNLVLYETVTSTNTIAKQMAKKSATHGSCIIAEEQTQGRGRLKRSFFSPKGSGIYLSIILRPNDKCDNLLITINAAVAVCRALKSECGIDVKIKWVNDIYFGKKKLCGILAESLFSQSSTPEYIILGIGINVKRPPSTPRELEGILTSIDQCNPKNYDINRLIAKLLNQLEVVLNEEKTSVIGEYKSHSLVLGKKINILNQDGQKIPATAIDIDNSGALIAQLENNEKVRLNFGEISIRLE